MVGQDTNTRKPLTVYKASAGSGKTFTLAIEYITLVIKNPNCFRNILAVTFTNKATEEMKMRILSQLYGIWKGLDDSRAYMEQIMKATGYGEGVISERAGKALNGMLHNFDYFRVTTIDAFFQSVLRNLAKELELTRNLQLEIDGNQMEERAVDVLIENLTVGDKVLKWLIEYITENISENKSWNVIKDVKRFGKQVLEDFYKTHAASLAEKSSHSSFFDNYQKTLNDLMEGAYGEMKDIANAFFADLEAVGMTIDDLSYKKSGGASYFYKILEEKKFDSGIVGARAKEYMESPEKWISKTHKLRNDLLPAVEERLMPHLLKAEKVRAVNWNIYKSAELTKKHLYKVRLLKSIDDEMKAINKDTDRFMLNDTQKLLSDLIDKNDSTFVFEKIGTQLDYIMIDEFQDTGALQWKNFLVLLRECISHEGARNLIVGDVKQSIYRWRAGDWRLLNGIEGQFKAEEIEVRNLDTNYRSQFNIIKFNNAFFHNAKQAEYDHLMLDYNEGDKREKEVWQLEKAYDDVEQKVPQNKAEATHEGYVKIQLLIGDCYEEDMLEHLYEDICELLDKGVPAGRIAILLRSNKEITRVADFLTARMPGVKFVSDEAFKLGNSPAVRIIVTAMRLLMHPDDMQAKALLAKNYQAYICGNVVCDHQLLDIRQSDKLLPAEYCAERDKLLMLPLYELAERLFIIFEIEKQPRQSAYLCNFFDMLNHSTAESNADIDRFLKEWDDAICNKRIQSDETDGIRLLTIHKSKGLEYDNVFVPFCDWEMEKRNEIWCEPSLEPYNTFPLIPITFSYKDMKETIYEGDFLHERFQNCVDNLNLLYVAFTRAGRNLFVYGKKRKKGKGESRQNGSYGNRSDIIQKMLPDLQQQLCGYAPAILQGNEDDNMPMEFEFGELSVAVEKSGKVSRNVFMQPVASEHLDIRTFQCQAEFKESNKSHEFVRVEDEDDAQRKNYIKVGNVLHNVFAHIQTSSDIGYALETMQQEGVFDDGEMTKEKVLAMLQKRLNDPLPNDWFSGRWRNYNECTILDYDSATDEVQEHRPDRVMTDGKEVIVVDFKFGKPKEEYHEQVRRYMNLIEKMDGKPVKGYLWFVYANNIIEVER